MEQTPVKTVLVLLVIIFVTLPITQKARAECDMWAWITTDADNLSTAGKNAYKESVKWYRWISKGLDGDVICDDGWSIWGHSTEEDSINWRRPGAPYANQVYHQNWNKQTDGMDFNWPPNIPESGPARHLDFAMSHSRASGSNVTYGNPHPFAYQLGGRTLAMQHNGLLYSYLLTMQALIGIGYWNMDLFAERPYNGQHPPNPLNDSEIYAMLLIKNVLLADNYGEDDLWAIKKTINQISGAVSYSSLNIYLDNGEEIYAACKSSTGQLNDHRIWYAYNNPNDRHHACIVTGNYIPGYSSPTWSYWATATEIPNGNWYKVDRELLCPESGSLGPVTDPSDREYAYLGRNPMIGNDASLAKSPKKDYIAVWSDGDGNIYYNYMDPMGLCERAPTQINPIGTGYEYRNADVIFDGSEETSPYFNHFWVAYERGFPGQPSNEICLQEMVYDSTYQSWTPGIPIVMNQINSEVGNPAVAWGEGKLLIAWQQKLPNVADWHIRTAAYMSGGGIYMSDRMVGEATLTEQREHPDILYVGSQGANEPIFVVSYMQKDLVAGNHGVFISRILTDPAPPAFTGDETYVIVQNPENTVPALAQANETGADRFVCAFRESPTAASHQVVALRIESPLEGYTETWYDPIEEIPTPCNSVALPGDVDPHFFEIDIASRENGSVDVAFTDYDDSSIPAQSIIKCFQYACPFMAGIDTSRIDADASATDMDPVIAIADWQGMLQRLILWNGHIAGIGEARLIANFDPPHFGGTGTAGSHQPVAVLKTAKIVPGYSLGPIYPNPFNPATTISFVLAQDSRVSLLVYNVTGRLVADLVNGWREAGTHELTFDGSELPSGIYLARFQAGDFTAVQKMVLMK